MVYKKATTYIATLLLAVNLVLPQGPVKGQSISWEKSYGGVSAELLGSIQQTSDGAYIVTGGSQSVPPHDNMDFWVLKLYTHGDVEWEKTFGGSEWDRSRDVKQTSDGGYIVVGETGSWDNDIYSYGVYDYWVIKLDEHGNQVWQKHYGGTKHDVPSSILQTSDDGYIIAGYSQSNDKDVSGNWGNYDYWIVKLDVSGKIQWERNYGGTEDDYAYSLYQTKEGGFVIAGSSKSDDKNLNGNYGDNDYWIVKLSPTGHLQWQQNYGGSQDDRANEIVQTVDGGYIVCGRSASTDNDVSGNFGNDDYWIIKLDSIGGIQWEQNYGGTKDDRAYSIKTTTDGGYIIVGESESNDYDVSDNYRYKDVWVLKLDSFGVIQWERNYGGSGIDWGEAIQQNSSNNHIIGAITTSGDHDVSKYFGNFDLWVFNIGAPIGINDSKDPSKVKLFNNPANDIITIEIGKQYDLIEIYFYNVLGQLISKNRFTGSNKLDLHLPDPKGIYFIQIVTETGQLDILKVYK